MKSYVYFAWLLLSALACADDSVRRWTDNTGAFRIEAVFIERRGDKVMLRDTAGQQRSVLWSRLSATDQAYVEELRAAAEPRSTPLPPACEACRGLGLLPRRVTELYTHTGDARAADAEESLVCRQCPRCKAGLSNDTLLRQEQTRIRDQAGSRHLLWEQELQMPLARVETRQLVLHSQVAGARAHEVALAIEAMTKRLLELTGSLMLTPRRPANDDMLLFVDKQGFEQCIVVLSRLERYKNINWDFVRRKVATTIDQISFLYSPSEDLPLENIAVHTSAYRQIHMATKQKAPAWLLEGFASFCEFEITGSNAMHGIVPQSGPVRLRTDWQVALRQSMRAGELRPWPELLAKDLAVFEPIDYFQSNSIVTFLMRDPPQFLTLVELVAAEVEDEAAIEKAYRKSLKKLEADWRRWLRKR